MVEPTGLHPRLPWGITPAPQSHPPSLPKSAWPAKPFRKDLKNLSSSYFCFQPFKHPWARTPKSPTTLEWVEGRIQRTTHKSLSLYYSVLLSWRLWGRLVTMPLHNRSQHISIKYRRPKTIECSLGQWSPIQPRAVRIWKRESWGSVGLAPTSNLLLLSRLCVSSYTWPSLSSAS